MSSEVERRRRRRWYGYCAIGGGISAAAVGHMAFSASVGPIARVLLCVFVASVGGVAVVATWRLIRMPE
jgi:hypothetical protein